MTKVATRTGGMLTVVSPLESDAASLDSLRALLLSVGEYIDTETVVHLRDLRLVHFVRWVIVPPNQPHEPHLLVFGSDFDGSLEEHLEELWRVSGTGLNQIYAHCVSRPQFSGAAELIGYFTAHRQDTAAAYSGTPARSAEQIRQESRLQHAIADYLDTSAGREAAKAKPVRAVRAFAKQNASPALDLDRPPASAEVGLARLLRSGAVYPIAGAALAVLGVPALLGLLAVKVREGTEDTDEQDYGEPDRARLETLKGREDHRRLVQNQLTHVVPIKPGWFRMTTLKVVLWSIGFLARNYYVRGDLGGIISIHYARWMILEKQRLLLFFSNFDGSWESYLGDFVDQAATGLTAVWSNTRGFPPACFLVFRGARDEESFKNWTRHHQIETQVWYSAYPDLSVQNVNDNTRLRAGLAREPRGKALEEWLRAL